jgi:SAM-dependent methyltransferase
LLPSNKKTIIVTKGEFMLIIRKDENRTLEQIKEHYKIKKELATKLRNCRKDERQYLYNALYDELFKQVLHHPQLIRKDNLKASAQEVARKMRLIAKFCTINIKTNEKKRSDEMKNQIKLLKEESEALNVIENYIKEYYRKGHPLRILEAGCGSSWWINVDEVEYTLIGVDVDRDALEKRKNEVGDLDEIIEGDLRDVDLNENEYDVVYSAFVLEHIDNAELALNNMTKSLKPGGLLIIRIPDRESVHGFITRITPFWFHIFYYKYVQGIPDAGKPGHGPYHTVYDPAISRKGIHQFCEQNGMGIIGEYGTPIIGWESSGIRPFLRRFVTKTIGGLSLGKLNSKYSNLTYVLQKKIQ